MAADARSMGAPSRASEIHRRQLLGGLGIASLFAASGTARANEGALDQGSSLMNMHTAVAFPHQAQSPWDAEMRVWRKSKFQTDTLWAQIQGREVTDAESDRLDSLAAAECEAWNRLMYMPAPDGVALLWKLEQIITPDEDGYTGSWSANVANQVLGDAKRLALNG
ncbi:hypothetical protein [Sphingomonas paucimobilis]|uniref:Uncharacterized protein n=1 Tax=Sphingomonas paucimobilis TaxID=13689 RepID=A0A7T3E653_SPHPI|nr:hypothetical protein [Sphingomonas paucimobilis]QPT09280.1 hypothetical protein I6G38_02945 [Sphingomonas paucimobilis]